MLRLGLVCHTKTSISRTIKNIIEIVERKCILNSEKNLNFGFSAARATSLLLEISVTDRNLVSQFV
jgi:hypothetical protein